MQFLVHSPEFDRDNYYRSYNAKSLQDAADQHIKYLNYDLHKDIIFDNNSIYLCIEDAQTKQVYGARVTINLIITTDNWEKLT